MSVATANGQAFAPGDMVILCDDGGVFRQTLYLTSSGSSDEPITYDGRGTAVLSGSDVVSGWTPVVDHTYAAAVVVQPSQLFLDGAFGDRKAGIEELADDLDWYWASGTLYLVSSSGNPDSVFRNPGVEASSRDICFGVGQADYVVIQGLTVRHSKSAGIFGWRVGSHLTVRDVVAEWNWGVGLGFSSDIVWGSYDHVVVEDNVARYNGTGGIALLGPAINSTIRRNRAYENGRYQPAGNSFDEDHLYTYGIKLWEGYRAQEGNEVVFNDCHHNGRGEIGDDQGLGVGIWVDGVQGDAANPNLIRFNKVWNNAGNGIFIEISSNTIIQNNILFNNATNTGGVDGFAAANIAVDARGEWTSENNLVFNNTSYGGRYGLKVVTYDWNGCTVDDNLVINNLVVAASEHNLYCNFGGDNDGVNGSGNVYENNNFGEESPSFVSWGNLGYDTYDAWESVYGQDSRSIQGDPKLAGLTHNSLFLSAISPCRDAGAMLGVAYGETLREDSAWPDSVVTEDQDALGAGWEVGAYGYSGQVPPIFSDGFEVGTASNWSAVVH